MKTPKHTSGPWSIVKAYPQGKSRIDIKAGSLCKIARIFHQPAAYDANARLIAAAPELLEACEYVLRELQLKWPSFHGDIKAELEVAIAKATGGAK